MITTIMTATTMRITITRITITPITIMGATITGMAAATATGSGITTTITTRRPTWAGRSPSG